jgi:hypothetical protein
MTKWLENKLQIDPNSILAYASVVILFQLAILLFHIL